MLIGNYESALPCISKKHSRVEYKYCGTQEEEEEEEEYGINEEEERKEEEEEEEELQGVTRKKRTATDLLVLTRLFGT